MYKQVPPTAPRCQHIHDNNGRCGSPALRGQAFCYWHSTARATNKKKTFEMPILDNPNSVQLAVSQVISLLMSGQITPYHASVAFYGLQISSRNEQRVNSYNRYAVSELTPAMEVEFTPAPNPAPTDGAVVPLTRIGADLPRYVTISDRSDTPEESTPSIPMPSLGEAKRMFKELSRAAAETKTDESRLPSNGQPSAPSKTAAPSAAAVSATTGTRPASSDPGKRPVASAKPAAKPAVPQDPVRDPDDLSDEELRVAASVLGFDYEDESEVLEFLRTTHKEEPSYYASVFDRMTARFRELHAG